MIDAGSCASDVEPPRKRPRLDIKPPSPRPKPQVTPPAAHFKPEHPVIIFSKLKDLKPGCTTARVIKGDGPIVVGVLRRCQSRRSRLGPLHLTPRSAARLCARRRERHRSCPRSPPPVPQVSCSRLR